MITVYATRRVAYSVLFSDISTEMSLSLRLKFKTTSSLYFNLLFYLISRNAAVSDGNISTVFLKSLNTESCGHCFVNVNDTP